MAYTDKKLKSTRKSKSKGKAPKVSHSAFFTEIVDKEINQEDVIALAKHKEGEEGDYMDESYEPYSHKAKASPALRKFIRDNVKVIIDQDNGEETHVMPTGYKAFLISPIETQSYIIFSKIPEILEYMVKYY